LPQVRKQWQVQATMKVVLPQLKQHQAAPQENRHSQHQQVEQMRKVEQQMPEQHQQAVRNQVL
jgi:hypothetical protein